MPTDAREHPILFSAPMVLAILSGAKTQTRRVIAAPKCATIHGREPRFDDAWVDAGPSPAGNPGPYLKLPITGGDYADDSIVERVYRRWFVGDRLWVRETFALSHADRDSAFEPDTSTPDGWDGAVYRADGEEQGGGWTDAEGKRIKPPWRPSIFMPRWASRITLEVTSIKVERLGDISEEDAKAEGVDHVSMADVPRQGTLTYRDDFAQLWQKINGKRPGCSWVDSPWVWVVGFKRLNAESRAA